MDFTTIDAYLNNLHFSDAYKVLEQAQKESIVFTAMELLKDNYRESKLTDRIASLQVLYMLEGEDEEYSKLRRHGVKSFSTKGIAVSLEGSGISPDVVTILGSGKKASVGRLI